MQLRTLRTTSWSLCNRSGTNPSCLHEATHGTDAVTYKEAENVEANGANNELALLVVGRALGVSWDEEYEGDVEKREQ